MKEQPMTLTRTSPAYAAHLAAKAVLAEKSRWRRVNYFGANAEHGNAGLRPDGADDWSPAIEAEHRAVRERAGLFDLTSFGKIRVSGPEAGTVLEYLCANKVDRGPGRLTYTQMLHPGGGVVADVTIAQESDTSFLVVTGTSALGHDLAWISTHAEGREAVVEDVTSSYACFGVWGPRARDVLASIVDTSLETSSFPYMTTKEAEIDGVPVRLSRVTFVGELGWEIYVPSDFGRSLWELLTDRVEQVGGLRAGYRAIDSLRNEKGYLYLGSDLTGERTPIAAGLGMFVRQAKDYVGKAVVSGTARPEEILRTITLNDEWCALAGGEAVVLDDGRRTALTSGGVGYTVGKSIGFAYLPADVEDGTAVQVEVGGRLLAGTVVPGPLYDPTGGRLRA
jgi:glycine cleavage system aminomethyltransferase T